MSLTDQARYLRAKSGAYYVQESGNDQFMVVNLENGHSYYVNWHPQASWTCTCRDYQERGVMCKHIWAVWLQSNPPLTVAVAPASILAGDQVAAKVIPLTWFQTNTPAATMAAL